MKLSQVKPHLSIRNLQDIQLPDFSVITGVNGSGKTHLLQALSLGHVNVDGGALPHNEISYYSAASLVPNDATKSSLNSIHESREWLLTTLNGQYSNNYPELVSLLSQYEIIEPSDPWKLCTLSKNELRQLLKNPSDEDIAYSRISEISNKITKSVRQSLRQNSQNNQSKISLIDGIVSDRGHIAGVDHEYFSRQKFQWRSESLFKQSFADMFLSYFEKLKANRLRLYDESQGRTPTVPALTEQQFVAAHGEAPWDFVNSTIRRARLDFEIDHPDDYESFSYEPRLKKTTSGTEVKFTSLSSGEKILMSFAFCLYYSADKRTTIQKPSVLLFDEIDAPLHPSMSRTLVETIVETLVKEQKTKVILATHSPSTVAVAPEGSIFLLQPETNKLVASTKRAAVASLTAEIPTLSISFDGRRQVFVESDFDAERYTLLYQALAPKIDSERSLIFISSGARAKTGHEEGTGCDRVRTVVNNLASGGNTTVFGLIDWDGSNSAAERIYVLGCFKFYSIENCLLNPALLGALLVREGIKDEKIESLNANYREIAHMEPKDISGFVDKIQEKVLAFLNKEEGKLVPIAFEGGFDCNVSSEYVHMRGHDLEAAIKDVFPALKRFKNNGSLLKYMCEVVVPENVRLLPVVVRQTFEEMCAVAT